MVRYALLEFHDTSWRDMLPIICYNIGNTEMTLKEISQGLLYGTAAQEEKTSKWKQLFAGCRSLPETKAVDPRFFFCLSWGCKSSPKIRTYHGQFLERELSNAGEVYCQEFITVDERRGLVTLPALFLLHAVDFGASTPALLEHLVYYFSLDQCAKLERLHFKYGTALKIHYSVFDWTKMFGATKSTMREEPSSFRLSIESTHFDTSPQPSASSLSRAPSQASIRVPLGAAMQSQSREFVSPLQPPIRHNWSYLGETKSTLNYTTEYRPMVNTLDNATLGRISADKRSLSELVLPEGSLTNIKSTPRTRFVKKKSSASSVEKSVHFDLMLPIQREHQVLASNAISALKTDWMIADLRYAKGRN
jgi:Protein of unknown function, DUF547